MKVCDADGRLGYGLISLAYRTMDRDGESLSACGHAWPPTACPSRSDPAARVDWIDTTKNIAREGAGNATINGIEVRRALGRATQ